MSKNKKHQQDDAAGDGHRYEDQLRPLQVELNGVMRLLKDRGERVVVIFEGRDTAGKGGVIKAISEKLNTRQCHIAALGIPTSREEGEWYFQRYVAYLPSAGEMTLFDRSWYNRAGVEAVMGYCTPAQTDAFLKAAPVFEKMLVDDGVRLFKYWLTVDQAEQEQRFADRQDDPLKQWKLSPMDLESRRRWELYTKAKEEMIERTHIPESRWWVVEGVDKKRARLNCIHHLLQQVPYQDVPHDPIVMPDRDHKPDYTRHPVPPDLYVPAAY